ncbi:hypothetical protein PAAG_07253 [Paracoccidioides lutzii Pb01]|uniref:Uncharacterized protein n=1 Tax=Paracoccidioides lutzii (strain ATCC MYA-826 / Pb01) TaxID=502779 RepID=C1H912_PARBA|nr:hypothetical protein PAAG_07253 [Paracoccidioides lutzii Pb01]EEH36835.2 hypothetical protein PAAG_07253 [Paracoccidioides lutzii Pb01]
MGEMEHSNVLPDRFDAGGLVKLVSFSACSAESSKSLIPNPSTFKLGRLWDNKYHTDAEFGIAIVDSKAWGAGAGAGKRGGLLDVLLITGLSSTELALEFVDVLCWLQFLRWGWYICTARIVPMHNQQPFARYGFEIMKQKNIGVLFCLKYAIARFHPIPLHENSTVSSICNPGLPPKIYLKPDG